MLCIMSDAPQHMAGGLDGAFSRLSAFIEANRARDEAAMAALLTANTIEAGGFAGPNPQFDEATLGDGEVHGDGWMIPIHPPAELAEAMPPLPAVMRLEDGDWKLDLPASMDLLFGGPGAAEQMAEELLGALGEAMGTAMGAMGEAMGALGDAFGGIDDGPEPEPGSLAARLREQDFPDGPWNDGNAEPYPSSAELQTLPPTFALPGTAQRISDALDMPLTAAMTFHDMTWPIDDDLRAQIDAYGQWVDDDLMAPWGDVLATVARFVPLVGRLSGIRFEILRTPGLHYVIVDGNTLVYRSTTLDGEKRHSPGELISLLIGTAHTLPPALLDQFDGANHEIPAEDIDVDPRVWFHEVAPRLMARLEAMVGHRVRLCVDPDRLTLGDERDMRLYRSGLIRILSGIGIALMAEDLSLLVRTKLHTLGLEDGFVNGPELRYEDGILLYTLPVGDHNTGAGFVEHQVAGALCGEVFDGMEEPKNGGEEMESGGEEERH